MGFSFSPGSVFLFDCSSGTTRRNPYYKEPLLNKKNQNEMRQRVYGIFFSAPGRSRRRSLAAQFDVMASLTFSTVESFSFPPKSARMRETSVCVLFGSDGKPGICPREDTDSCLHTDHTTARRTRA